MKTTYEVLREALIEVFEIASGDTYSEQAPSDDDDLAELAMVTVTALRDAFEEADHPPLADPWIDDV